MTNLKQANQVSDTVSPRIRKMQEIYEAKRLLIDIGIRLSKVNSELAELGPVDATASSAVWVACEKLDEAVEFLSDALGDLT